MGTGSSASPARTHYPATWLRQRRFQAMNELQRAKGVGRLPAGGPGIPAETAKIDSRDLLGGNREIRIVHGNEVYRLLVTRNGKLILQK